MIVIITALACSLAGLGIGFFASKSVQSQKEKEREKELEEKAKLVIKEAEILAEKAKNERILESKEKYLRLKAEFEEDVNKRKQAIAQGENRIKQREQQLAKQIEDTSKKEADLDTAKKNIVSQQEIIQKRKEEIEKLKNSHIENLEKIANLKAEEAKEQLVEILKNEAQTKASSYIKDMMEEAKLTATKESKMILLQTLQRTASEVAIENCVSVFNIESDDIKGKIIGREGRNIRALEAATGVEVIVDDTPETIIISGFDPVRREIARLSLHRLVQDGRIHPARIEEVVAKTTKNIEDEIVEIGEKTCIDLGIHGLHPELIKMVGRMRFRSSYGQNLLQHSREVAKLCSTLAAELGLNAKMAKRAGLLHDIGKVFPEEIEKPHAIVGMEMAMKYKEHPEICNAIGAHHDEIEMTSILSPIIQICDSVSGSRPGARREVMEAYMKRLHELEDLALNFDGVNKCYAIQAGRELRVLVDSEKVDDKIADQLSYDIAQKIEKDMQYPGQIKVTVIREMRSVNYAK